MLTMTDLENYTIGATDGAIGNVEDVYFDDEKWVVRYFIVAIGEWLSGRRVLISPRAIGKPKCAERILPASLTRSQVSCSPRIDADRPVSRQNEMDYLGYYGYPCYWGATGQWETTAMPGALVSHLGYGGTGPDYLRAQAEKAPSVAEAAGERHKHDDHHLRSGTTVMRYHLHASDGDIGHAQDFSG